jgi:hypothetical protein
MLDDNDDDLKKYLLENSLEHFSDLLMHQRAYIENQEKKE